MLGYLILLFTLLPLVELALLIKVGQYFGVIHTIGIVVLTGIVGAYLAKVQGFITIRRIQQDMSQGIMPGDQILNGVIILCSGIVLLTPGLITDFLGFLGLIPFTRNIFKSWLKHKIKQHLMYRR